jgi:hypothetical protein
MLLGWKDEGHHSAHAAGLAVLEPRADRTRDVAGGAVPAGDRDQHPPLWPPRRSAVETRQASPGRRLVHRGTPAMVVPPGVVVLLERSRR